MISLDSTPFILDLPFLANIIAILEGERLLLLKTTWAHPFTRADDFDILWMDSITPHSNTAWRKNFDC